MAIRLISSSKRLCFQVLNFRNFFLLILKKCFFHKHACIGLPLFKGWMNQLLEEIHGLPLMLM